MKVKKEIPLRSFNFRQSTVRKSGRSLVNAMSRTKEFTKKFNIGKDTVIFRLEHGVPHIGIIDSEEDLNGSKIQEKSNSNSDKKFSEAKEKSPSADTGKKNRSPKNVKNSLSNNKHKLQNKKAKCNQSQRRKVSRRK